MTYSTADGTVVKRKGNKGPRPNARKEWIVIRMDTYVGALKMWKPTLPMTIKQASNAFNHFSRWDDVAVKMITVKEWEQMQNKIIDIKITLQGSLFFVTHNEISHPFLTRESAQNFAKGLSA